MLNMWSVWHTVHHWPLWLRWPVKVGVFALVLVLVLYPKLWLLPVWYQRLQHMNSVLDPNHPALEPLEERVRAAVAAGAAGGDVYAAVERQVCARVPYAFDWDVWGVMDYLPTVDEVFRVGREDCDGRAVVAASLLRRMGYDATLATDIKHVWVVTPQRELMSPGQGPKSLVGGRTGTEARLTLASLSNVGRSLAYGVAVFPLARELIITAALCALTLHPWSRWQRRAVGCGLLFAALIVLRLAGPSAGDLARQPLAVWLGAALAVSGWAALLWRSRPRRTA